MEARESFVFYRSFYDAIKEFPVEQRERVFSAICEYAIYGNEIELSGIEKAIFTVIKPSLDSNRKKYESGKKGGRPKKENQKKEPAKPKDSKEDKPESQESKTNGFSKQETSGYAEQENTVAYTVADAVSVSDTDTGSVNESVSGSDVPFPGAQTGKVTKANARNNDIVFNEPAFNDFWEAYPRKVSKQPAIKAWNKLKPDEGLFETIMSALEKQKKMKQWEDSQFIPHPSTWLNERRWEDEISPDKLTEKPKKSDDDYWAGFYHPTPEERAAPPWHGYKDIE